MTRAARSIVSVGMVNTFTAQILGKRRNVFMLCDEFEVGLIMTLYLNDRVINTQYGIGSSYRTALSENDVED